MKPLLYCALGLTLSLTACSSSTGGFTLSGMSGDATRRSTPSLSNANETANALASPDSGMQEKLKSGFDPVNTLSSWGGGYSLKVESNGNVALSNHYTKVVYKPDDMGFYTKEGVDFAVMVRAEQIVDWWSDVEMEERHSVWIGRLNYASFGYWAVTTHYYDAGGTALDNSGYFHDGKRAQYNGISGLSFTGVAAGTAESRNAPFSVIGTASLDIASSSSGTLVLTFPDFYKFTGSVRTSTQGNLTGSFTEIQKLSGYISFYSIDLPTSVDQLSDNKITGQLYGNSVLTPTEAAGAWELGRGDIFVRGVFGVKKQ